MRFKRNVTVTLACVITECLISLIPSICILFLLFWRDEIGEMFFVLLMLFYFIIIINVLLLIIAISVQFFLRTVYYVNKTCLVVKTKSDVVEINYNEICGITYDYGDLTRFNTKPSQLVLFGKDYRQVLAVDNPSIIMVHMIRKKCKINKVSYYNRKRFLYLSILINVIVLFSTTLIKLFV